MGVPDYQRQVAQVPRKSLARIGTSDTVGVAAGASKSVTIYGPVGFICKTSSVWINANPVAGAAAGTYHRMYFKYSNASEYLMYAKSTAAVAISFNYSYWYSADNATQPVDKFSQAYLSQNIYFDDVTGLTFTYYNDADVANVSTRSYFLNVVKEQVGQ